MSKLRKPGSNLSRSEFVLQKIAERPKFKTTETVEEWLERKKLTEVPKCETPAYEQPKDSRFSYHEKRHPWQENKRVFNSTNGYSTDKVIKQNLSKRVKRKQ
jgi:hypothetical protein